MSTAAKVEGRTTRQQTPHVPGINNSRSDAGRFGIAFWINSPLSQRRTCSSLNGQEVFPITPHAEDSSIRAVRDDVRIGHCDLRVSSLILNPAYYRSAGSGGAPSSRLKFTRSLRAVLSIERTPSRKYGSTS